MPAKKYKEIVYSTGFALRVTPEDRSMDVLHYLITGYLLGDRSLEGVTWEELEDSEHQKRLTKALTESMREIK